jgi:hypothetical protein
MGELQLRLRSGLYASLKARTLAKSLAKRCRTPARAVRTRFVASRAVRRDGATSNRRRATHARWPQPLFADPPRGGAEPFGARRGWGRGVGFSKSTQDLVHNVASEGGTLLPVTDPESELSTTAPPHSDRIPHEKLPVMEPGPDRHETGDTRGPYRDMIYAEMRAATSREREFA